MNPNGHHAMNGYRSNNVASTSSDTYNDFIPQRANQPLFTPNHQQQQPGQQQHLSQSMQHHVSQNQWQDLAMQLNNQQVTGNPVSLQRQQQFNPGPWGNQMPPPQTFSNTMPMGAFNMPYLPPHILQEALAMSTPVEAADEPTLLTKLLSSARREESYKDALNSLHGKNGHSASLWKDYYLDNRIRLDAWISMCLQKEKEGSSSSGVKRSASSEHTKVSLPTAKKPSPATFKREPSPQNSFSRVSISAPSGKRPQKRSNQSTPPIVTKDQPQGGRRSTINSLTAPSPVFGGRLPAPNADIKIPDPPSRSPSPPTNIIPHRGRGNKYTNEDREFFIKFVGWRLKKNPSLTRHDICELLAEKAPHHTAQSWASHWSNNHDVPDKILAAARGEEYNSEGSSEEEEEEAIPRRRPKYKDATTSEESDEESDADDENEEPDNDSDEADETPLRHYSDEEMGERGGPFNDADLYITAKYIATFSDWDNTNSKDRWEPYHEKYPQRSAKSWAEYYRRNERPLTKLVKRLHNEGTKATVPSIQCARPTRTPPKAKRKFNYDSNEDSFVKRGRAD